MTGVATAAQASDAELMRRTQRGDPAAFAQLVRRWQPKMGRFLARLAGPAADASDLCQELFLKLYLARDRYREAGTFSAWLYRLALNLARDAQRRGRRWPRLLEAADEGPSQWPTDEPQRQEEQEQLAAALADLPEPQREVVVLRLFEEMNFEAMARLLGTPATTLKSRFAAALVRLKERLSAQGWAEPEMET